MADVKLLVKTDGDKDWSTVASRQYDPSNINSLADAVEGLLKNKDDWIASGHFPANAAWFTSVGGRVPTPRPASA